MEIERVVSGDLSKNIEQCVTLLMDVERKVHALKNELGQTLGQLQVQRQVGYAAGATIANPAAILGIQAQAPLPVVPQVGAIPAGVQATQPQAILGYPAFNGYGTFHGFAPWASLPALRLPLAATGITPGFNGIQALQGLPTVPVQNLGAVNAVPGYGYIW